MKKINFIQILRIIVLSFFLIVVTVASFRHQILGGGPQGSPSIHAICPFGGIETIYKVVAGGEFLKRTYISNFILLGSTIVIAILLGRFFCGWLCAVGWMQELFGKLGALIFRKKNRFRIPIIVDKPLRYLKYVALGLILFFTWRMADLIISPFDPFAAYAHIPAGLGELFGEFLIGTIILLASLILSIFFDRFFCKYLCPMGAFLGILNKISLFRIKRDESTCTHCNLCSKVCPMNIDVAKLKSVYRAECINCMECVTACPTKKDTLKTTIAGKTIRPIIIAIIGIAIYLGVIGITNLTGIWKTTETSLTEVVEKGGNLDPYSIRGFMTLKDIAETFHIDIKQIYSELQLNINDVPPTVKAKELSNYNPNLNEDSVREAIAKIIGFNKNDEKLSEETKDEANIDTSTIKGSMTIKEVCETFGINKDDLLKKIGVTELIPETYTLKKLKEHIQQTNPQFEIESVRNAVKQIINKKPND